jgi:hypothetical protein
MIRAYAALSVKTNIGMANATTRNFDQNLALGRNRHWPNLFH